MISPLERYSKPTPADAYETANRIRTEKQKACAPKELVWNVIAEDSNGGIGFVNALDYNWPVRAYIYRAYRETSKSEDFDSFAKQVQMAIQHEYWARSEYEIIVTEWPTSFTEEELDRMKGEIAEHKKQYPDSKYARAYPRFDKAEKIDVYDQIMMNWDAFINYLWDNRKLIKSFKEDFQDMYGRKDAYPKKPKSQNSY